MVTKSRLIEKLKQHRKRILDFVPGGRRIRKASSYVEDQRRIRAIGLEGVFTRIYEQNLWSSEESVSGPGSTIESTQSIRNEIPRIIDRFGVKRILDAPCGDYNWFRFIERDKDIHYEGGDIVEALVINNQEKYGNEYTRFKLLDIRNDELPEADLWLCRDCLQHLSNSDVFKVIRNLLNSDIRYFLASTYTLCKMNKTILTGRCRALNLELPPFKFCKPILYVDDWIEGWPVRHLALWEKRQLSESLTSNKALRRI